MIFDNILFNKQWNNNTVIDDNDLNKKQKLEHGLTDTNLEGGNNNSIGKSGNVAAVNDNINHSNASTVDVCNSKVRKSCAHTKTTLPADWWGFYQLNEFLGKKCPKQMKPKILCKIGSEQTGNLQINRNIATKETISAIKKWNNIMNICKTTLQKKLVTNFIPYIWTTFLDCINECNLFNSLFFKISFCSGFCMEEVPRIIFIFWWFLN